MIGGMRRRFTINALIQPTPIPSAAIANIPRGRRASWPLVTLVATNPDRVITLGIDKSTAPFPVVTTSVWPIATTQSNAAAAENAGEIAEVHLARSYAQENPEREDPEKCPDPRFLKKGFHRRFVQIVRETTIPMSMKPWTAAMISELRRMKPSRVPRSERVTAAKSTPTGSIRPPTKSQPAMTTAAILSKVYELAALISEAVFTPVRQRPAASPKMPPRRYVAT